MTELLKAAAPTVGGGEYVPCFDWKTFIVLMAKTRESTAVLPPTLGTCRGQQALIRMMTLRLQACSAPQDDPPPAGMQCSAR
jgi:hypothetical protein